MPSEPKLTLGEQQELNKLPAVIDELEQEVNSLQAEMSETAFYQQPAKSQQVKIDGLASLEKKLNAAYQRWEQLDDV